MIVSSMDRKTEQIFMGTYLVVLLQWYKNGQGENCECSIQQ